MWKYHFQRSICFEERIYSHRICSYRVVNRLCYTKNKSKICDISLISNNKEETFIQIDMFKELVFYCQV